MIKPWDSSKSNKNNSNSIITNIITLYFLLLFLLLVYEEAGQVSPWGTLTHHWLQCCLLRSPLECSNCNKIARHEYYIWITNWNYILASSKLQYAPIMGYIGPPAGARWPTGVTCPMQGGLMCPRGWSLRCSVNYVLQVRFQSWSKFLNNT